MRRSLSSRGLDEVAGRALAEPVPSRDRPIGLGGTPQTPAGLWWERHPRLLHAVALGALVWGIAWLAFRSLFTWRGADPAAFPLLLGVEAFNLLSLGFLVFHGWSWHPASRPAPTPGRTVDVFVCTYDEPIDVVEATLAGCAALAYPHVTWLLDDGRRPEMADLAQRWGARWLARPDNRHAKAGNINHALHFTDGELILFLDADHAPLPDSLDAVVGYFDEPDVALVQTPHDFYNQDSVQHYEPGRHEQSLFFEVISPGKDEHNAAFWCGSATLVRRAALEQVGGVATETIAEDFHTTIRMHRLGWRTRYHNEVLVQGLAPVDLDGYLLQRDRWARGNLAVFRLPESPLRRHSGLDLRQRVAYFASLFAYGAGLARLTIIGLLVAVLSFGVLPAQVPAIELLVLWVPATLLAITATAALCRGHMRLAESSHYALVTAEVFTRALRCAVWPSRTKFTVTPKEGTDTGGWHAVRRLRLVLLASALLALALMWRLLGLVGLLPVRHLPAMVTVLAMLLAMWELLRAGSTIRRVAARRQMRVHYRFACRIAAELEDPDDRARPATGAIITDASTAGFAALSERDLPVGTRQRLSFTVPGVADLPLAVVATVHVRVCIPDAVEGWRVGLQVVDIDEQSRRNLLTFCHVVHPFRQLRGLYGGGQPMADDRCDDAWNAEPAPAPANL